MFGAPSTWVGMECGIRSAVKSDLQQLSLDADSCICRKNLF